MREHILLFELSVLSVFSVVNSFPFSIIFTCQKPFLIHLAQAVDALVLDLYIPFLSFPGPVPPFRIRLPNAAVFQDAAAEILSFDKDQPAVPHQHLSPDGWVKVAERDHGNIFTG